MSEQFIHLCWEPNRSPPRPTMQAAIETIALKHGVTVEEIKGQQRNRKVVAARQEFFFEAHTIGRSYPQAGAFCGGRDHTTALHGKRRHEGRLGL